MPDSYPVLLEKALAQTIADAGLGVYKPTGTYTKAETPVATPGITTNGPDLPTAFDNCIVLTMLEPASEGRANMVWRVQILGRLMGTKTQAKDLLWNLRVLFDNRGDILNDFHVSWSWVFSSITFTADASQRHSFALTVYLRGRRPIV